MVCHGIALATVGPGQKCRQEVLSMRTRFGPLWRNHLELERRGSTSMITAGHEPHPLALLATDLCTGLRMTIQAGAGGENGGCRAGRLRPQLLRRPQAGRILYTAQSSRRAAAGGDVCGQMRIGRRTLRLHARASNCSPLPYTNSVLTATARRLLSRWVGICDTLQPDCSAPTRPIPSRFRDDLPRQSRKCVIDHHAFLR